MVAVAVGTPAAAEPTPSAAVASYLPAPPAVGPVAAAPLPPQVEDAGDLTPAMADAWNRAVAGAKAEGVVLTMTSGYRSGADQQELWVDGLRKYGTEAEARKWVAVPWESAHVRGIAVDAGPNRDSMAWLEKNQDRFGLCRRFDNEPWHFELRRPEWPTCPPMVVSAATTLR